MTAPLNCLHNSDFLEVADETFPVRLSDAYSSANFNNTCSVIKEAAFSVSVICIFQPRDGNWLPQYLFIFSNKNYFSLPSLQKPKLDKVFSQVPDCSLFNFLVTLTGLETMPIFKGFTFITSIEMLNKVNSDMCLITLG